jgi:methylated-DNA-[protein]-cysteine S-methyltransferase
MANADNTAYSAVVTTPIGLLGVRIDQQHLCGIDFVHCTPEYGVADDPLARRIVAQLDGYFDDPRQCFDIPLKLRGTAFQRRVWRVLRELPVGETVSYGELARRLGSGARAVGNACRRNPAPVLVPCHRVVAAHGVGGYGGKQHGARINVKRWLLAHEGRAHA